jgi:hypothetical protein
MMLSLGLGFGGGHLQQAPGCFRRKLDSDGGIERPTLGNDGDVFASQLNAEEKQVLRGLGVAWCTKRGHAGRVLRLIMVLPVVF